MLCLYIGICISEFAIDFAYGVNELELVLDFFFSLDDPEAYCV